MGRGGRTGSKRSNNHDWKKSMDSEDSDEDYVAEADADEIDEQSDELDSLVGDASGDESCFEVEEEEEEEEEEDWRTVVKPRARKGSARSRNNGIRRPKKRRKVTCDDDEDSDDDDDEEFTPDDIDSLDEDEEFPLPRTMPRTMPRTSKKRGRTTSKRKTSVKTRRRKSTKAVREPLRKKSKKTGSMRRKAESDDDGEDFNEKGPTLRCRSTKKPVHRKKRVRVGSDSDFCSDPSDYEFTISEEEREQIREANEICRTLTTNLRSARSNQEDEDLYETRKPPVRKGKEKAEETKNDTGKPVCGICLTEEGKNTIRGTLNCCSHYFCFACIMEWSKVESRCPLCKQRFVTICKLSRCAKGLDRKHSVVAVPERDQVYQPSEEELRDFLNPYENVICTECHHGGDDALMLLCDLCDSPAHTYCVGLGREVPEGNWYCDGCRPAALGSSNSQVQDLTPNYDAAYRASPYENMAEIDLNVTIPETPISQNNGFLPSPRYSGGSFQAPSPVSGTGASTVFGRRRIHRQIQVFLSNRLSQIPPNAELSTLRSLLGGEVNLTPQQSRTDVGTSLNARHVDRPLEIPTHDMQNRDLFVGRLGRMMGQVGQASTSADGSGNSHRHWNGLDGNWGRNQTHISSSEQLRPCTGRSSIGPVIATPPSHNRNEDHVIIVKQQVVSIVNSQLKSLCRDMELGHDDYGIISRKATDTIMVACRLEPPRRDIHEACLPHCPHMERMPNVAISPVNNCCLTCFEGYVKEVVKRMMDITLGLAHRLHFR